MPNSFDRILDMVSQVYARRASVSLIDALIAWLQEERVLALECEEKFRRELKGLD